MLNVILMHGTELAPSGCENYVLVCDVGKGTSERYCLDLARISGKGMGVGKAVRKCRLVRVSNKDWMRRTQGETESFVENIWGDRLSLKASLSTISSLLLSYFSFSFTRHSLLWWFASLVTFSCANDIPWLKSTRCPGASSLLPLNNIPWKPGSR